ncbi:MAG TPA: hypothetical protein PKE45_00190 [Caldilineaceae bacterium]|nr:hypothetical protein [Caldilineaceae bacterium]
MRVQFPPTLTRLSLLIYILIVFVLLPLLAGGMGFLLVNAWLSNLFLALLAGLVAGGWMLCFLECYVIYPEIRNVQQ